MTKSERLKAAFRGEQPDRLPWAVWPGFMVLGAAERELRNRGMGLYLPIPVHVLDPKQLDTDDEFMTEPEHGLRRVRRSYRTPHGTLTATLEHSYKPAFHVMFAEMAVYPPGLVPTDGISQHGHDMTGGAGREQTHAGLAPRTFPFKSAEDYSALQHIIENTLWLPSYKQMARTLDWMGDEGVPMAVWWNSPFQELANDWMGRERCYDEWQSNPDAFQEVYEILAAKQRELFPILLDSPADVIWIGDDLDGDAVTPEAFDTFFAPLYDELAEAAHAKGKLVGVYASGKLKGLAEQIAATEIDFLDGVQAPPAGDLDIAEAREILRGKTLCWNLPGDMLTSDSAAIRKHVEELLEAIAPGDRFVLSVSSPCPLEGWLQGYRQVAKVLEERG